MFFILTLLGFKIHLVIELIHYCYYSSIHLLSKWQGIELHSNLNRSLDLGIVTMLC